MPVALPAHSSSPCGAWAPAGALSSTVGRRAPLAPSSCSCRASWMRVTSNTQLLVGWRVAPWRAALLAAHAARRGRVSRAGAPAACRQQDAASSRRSRRAAWSGWCACVMHSISSWPESETLSCRSHHACGWCCLQDDRSGANPLQSQLLVWIHNDFVSRYPERAFQRSRKPSRPMMQQGNCNMPNIFHHGFYYVCAALTRQPSYAFS